MAVQRPNDICGGFQMPMYAAKFTFLFFVIILLNVKSDVQQPPIPPRATPPTVDKFMKREHSLIKPFQGAGFGLPNWDFLGTTMVTSSHVRLTADKRSQTGAIWNNQPVWSRNWELQIHFRVTGTKKDLFGDGFAIWYVRDRMQAGRAQLRGSHANRSLRRGWWTQKLALAKTL